MSAALLTAWPAAGAVGRAAREAAAEGISTSQLGSVVAALADDTFEGRESGSRGGRAAALYLVGKLKELGIAGGGVDGGFYQPFSAASSNLLAVLPGSDPELKREYVIVGAHFDHVGYGTPRNSYGPWGKIHNGADDNASGVAGLLAVVEACTRLTDRPRRSLLFAFWDGEEQGLLGSKHWLAQPTVPLDKLAAMVNADMIGRLRQQRVYVYGARTGAGLRRLVCAANRGALTLDFNWDLRPDSDHHPFFEQGLPVLMFHTGLHGDYHRPSDDSERVDSGGVQAVARLVFDTTIDLADRAETIRFRPAARQEAEATRLSAEQPLPPLPPRLGVRMRTDAQPGLILSAVTPGSPAAAADLRVGDRILRAAGQELRDPDELTRLAFHSRTELALDVQRGGAAEPLAVAVKLPGQPLRVGMSWREDLCEPGTVLICRVVPGSPAAVAGLAERDRIYRFGDREFRDSGEFDQLLSAATGSVDLLVESAGRLRTVKLELPAAAP